MTSVKNIDRQEFERDWEGLCVRVFSKRMPPENPFAKSRWPMTLLPGCFGWMNRPDFDALKSKAEAVGDDEFLLVDAEDQWPDEPSKLLTWDWHSFDRIGRDTVYGHIQTYALGRSGRWGLLISYDTYTVLGAEPELMSAFFEHVGGEESVKKRFIKSVDDGDVGFGEEGRLLAKKLMKMVGWEQAPWT